MKNNIKTKDTNTSRHTPHRNLQIKLNSIEKSHQKQALSPKNARDGGTMQTIRSTMTFQTSQKTAEKGKTVDRNQHIVKRQITGSIHHTLKCVRFIFF